MHNDELNLSLMIHEDNQISKKILFFFVKIKYKKKTRKILLIFINKMEKDD